VKKGKNTKSKPLSLCWVNLLKSSSLLHSDSSSWFWRWEIKVFYWVSLSYKLSIIPCLLWVSINYSWLECKSSLFSCNRFWFISWIEAFSWSKIVISWCKELIYST